MQTIDKTTYLINEVNRYKTTSVKTQIVLGTSLRKNSYHISRLLHKNFGNSKKWNTYTITREGLIYQHYDNKYHTDYLGIKEADKKSISIVLENMGCLFETSGKYINWLNEVCDESSVIEIEWNGYEFFEQFTDAQMESTVELCSMLCEEHSIPKKVIDFHNFHKDIVKYRGIAFSTNYFEDGGDINPLFEIKKFNEMLHKEFI